jgi:hypothetical protein
VHALQDDEKAQWILSVFIADIETSEIYHTQKSENLGLNIICNRGSPNASLHGLFSRSERHLDLGTL